MLSSFPKAQLRVYFVSDAISSSSNVNVIYIDLMKAFDKIKINTNQIV